jgi:hypothetical protein
MTIDERLEALAERRQALTETVELLTHDIAELRAIVAQDAENIRELAYIVRSHERRTSDLEGEGKRNKAPVGHEPSAPPHSRKLRRLAQYGDNFADFAARQAPLPRGAPWGPAPIAAACFVRSRDRQEAVLSPYYPNLDRIPI